MYKNRGNILFYQLFKLILLPNIVFIMKKFALLFWAIFFSIANCAEPSRRVWRTVTQPDGTQLRIMLVGDEYLHYWVTEDNVPVVMGDGNTYYYADISDSGVEATEMVAHNAALRTQEETAFLKGRSEASLKPVIRRARAKSRAAAPHKFGKPVDHLWGSKKGLVILVSFNDVDFTTPDPKQAISDMCNKVGYDVNGSIGSVHDYFYDQSYNVFDLTFDVVGPYQAPNVMSYYGKNDTSGMYKGTDNPTRVRELIKFAMNSANAEVNYKDYDWDEDGEVDQVYVIYAGFAEASGASPNTIWPHESVLGKSVYVDNRLRLDGVYLNTYACGSELAGTEADENPVLDGIGTTCHEFSHCLGLPDMYDTTYGGNYGMDKWDLMDAGAYNGNNNIPPPLSGFERAFCGWLKYKDLKEPCKVTGMKPISEGGDVYRIVNPGHENEFYVIENRNSECKWDNGMSAKYLGKGVSGLLITHVTYDEERFTANSVNDATDEYGRAYDYQCVTPFHADNSDETIIEYNGLKYIDSDEYVGDLYPCTQSGKRNNKLSDDSEPAAMLNYPNTDGTYLMHCTLDRIAKRGKLVDFRYNAGTMEYPGYLLGDIDKSGEVNTSDVTRLYNVIFGTDTTTDPAICDIDNSGDLLPNTSDVTALYNIIFGTAQ